VERQKGGLSRLAESVGDLLTSASRPTPLVQAVRQQISVNNAHPRPRPHLDLSTPAPL
jgi:hypothetical protein